jgi:type I restriction enzyme M protein
MFRHARCSTPTIMYQHLMDYWAETMQDDCYIIAADGWKCRGTASRDPPGQEQRQQTRMARTARLQERQAPLQIGPRSRAALLVNRYFIAAERDAIAAIDAELAAIEQQLDEKGEEQQRRGWAAFRSD